MISAPDLDAVGFLRALVERRGGILEPAGIAGDGDGDERARRRVDLVLPADLAARLGIAEFSTGVDVGLGSPVLEAALREARGGVAFAALAADGLHLKSEGLLALAVRRLRAGNARLRAVGAVRQRASVLVATVRYAAVSDEVREGLVTVAVDMGDLTSVPEIERVVEDLHLHVREARSTGAAIAARDPAKVGAAIAREALPRIERDVRPFVAAMGRRLERDLGRVHTYYSGLLAEQDDPRRARRPWGRNRSAAPSSTPPSRRDPAEAAARRAEARRAIESERDRKLADSARRYAVRVDLALAAALRLDHEEISCELDLQRRAARRRLFVSWSPLLKDLKPLVCEGCLAEITSFDACDDAVHVLCPRCAAPRKCPACAAARR